jgi:hypothetical protein
MQRNLETAYALINDVTDEMERLDSDMRHDSQMELPASTNEGVKS